MGSFATLFSSRCTSITVRWMFSALVGLLPSVTCAISVGDTVQVQFAGDATNMRVGPSTTANCYGQNYSSPCPSSSKVYVGQLGSVGSVQNAGGFEWLFVTWQSTGISAWSASGPSGANGQWIAAVPRPGTPSLSYQTPVCLSNAGAVQLNWSTTANTNSYLLFQNGTQIANLSLGTRSYQATALTLGATYTFILKAQNSYIGVDSPPISVSISAALCTPTGTAPVCTPSADSLSIAVGSQTTLRANCTSTTAGGGGTVFTTWSGPNPANGPALTGSATAADRMLAVAPSPGTFVYTIVGSDFYGNDTKTIAIQVTPPVSNGISAISPSNGATGASTTPSFSWTALSGSPTYAFALETINPPSPAQNISFNYASTSTTLPWSTLVPGPGGLAVNQQYRWRIGAGPTATPTSYSDWFSFTTNNTPAPGVVAIGPSVNFGEVRVGGCATIQVAVVQHLLGTAPAVGSYVTTAPFDTPGNNTFSVSNGSYAPLVLRFCPTSLGVVSRAVTVSGVISNTPMTVTGTGVGTATPPTDSRKLTIDTIPDQHAETPFPIRILASSASLNTSVYLSTA